MNMNLMKKILIVFLGIFAVPFFGGLFAICSLGAIVSVIAGVIRTFGNTWIPMIWMNKDVPAIYSIPFSLIAALMCAMFAFIGYKGLKYYLKVFKVSFHKA